MEAITRNDNTGQAQKPPRRSKWSSINQIISNLLTKIAVDLADRSATSGDRRKRRGTHGKRTA